MNIKYFILFLAALLPACASSISPKASPEQFAGRYATRDVEISWRDVKKPDGLSVQGVLKNKFYFYLRDVELTAHLVDAGQQRISKDAYSLVPGRLAPDETSSFILDFPLSGQAPARIKFYLKYRIIEEKYSDIPYFQSFEAEVR